MSAASSRSASWRALGSRPDPKRAATVAPSDSTFFRVLNGIDAAEFDLRIGQWMMARRSPFSKPWRWMANACAAAPAPMAKPPLQLLSAVSLPLALRWHRKPFKKTAMRNSRHQDTCSTKLPTGAGGQR